MSRNAWVEIDLNAIKNNVFEVKKKLKKSTLLCVVVKANAYGHGAVECAKKAIEAGADFLAVALLQEAIELKENGIDKPILILGAMQIEDSQEIVEKNFRQAVFTFEGAKALDIAARRVGEIAKIHLVVETGMNRIGKKVSEIEEFGNYIKTLKNIEVEGVFSHFATADSINKSFDNKQFTSFQKALKILAKIGIKPKIRHIANSASLSEEAGFHLDMVRQGITFYGLWPSENIEHDLELMPVMKVKAKISYLKDIEIGETIGYGRAFRARKRTKVATLPIGYADGISRKLSNRGYFILKNQPVDIIGKVCMDQLMLDVTHIKNIKIGDEVTIFGCEELPVEKMAEWCDTINYEVVCQMNNRLSKIFINK